MSDLRDELTAALHKTLVDLHGPEVGHSLTGDVRALHDDAERLANTVMNLLRTTHEND